MKRILPFMLILSILLSTSVYADTLGFTTKGGNSRCNSNIIQGSYFTMSNRNGIVGNFTLYTSSSGSVSIKCAIYKSSNNALVAWSEEITQTFSSGWYTFDLNTSNANLSANTQYYIAMWGSGTSCVWYNSGSGASVNLGYGDFPNPITGLLVWYSVMSIYVTYDIIPDANAPTYSNNATNTTYANEPCNFTLEWQDDTELEEYIFSTNNTGAWANSSAVQWSGTPASATSWNVSTLNPEVGAVIAWKFYAKDIFDNWNASDTYYLTTINDTVNPTYSNPLTNNTYANKLTEFNLTANDNKALYPNGGYVFSTNASGTWQNSSFVQFISTPEVMNGYATLGDVGEVAGWCFYFNDSAGLWNATSCDNPYTLTVEREFPYTFGKTTKGGSTYGATDWIVGSKFNSTGTGIVGKITVALGGYGNVSAGIFNGSDGKLLGYTNWRNETWSDTGTNWVTFDVISDGGGITILENQSYWLTIFVKSYTTTFDYLEEIATGGADMNVNGTEWEHNPVFYPNGNWFRMGIYASYTTEDWIAPEYSSPSTNTTKAGDLCEFKMKWDDNFALQPDGQYVFSTNNTGTWLNDTAVNFSSTPEFALGYDALNSTVGTVVAWCFYATDDNGNSNNSCANPDILVTTADQYPIIYFIESIPAQDPVEGSTKAVVFNISVYDANGYGDISIVNATANYSGTTRFDSSCSEGDIVNSTARNYSCSIGLWYYDDSGVWDLDVYAYDSTGSDSESSSFTYNTLTAWNMTWDSGSQLVFPTLYRSDADILASNYIIMENTGNADLSNIEINATDLVSNGNTWTAGNFSSNTANACDGIQMVTDTYVTITGASLSSGLGSQEELYFCAETVPIIPFGTYTAVWTIRSVS